MKSRLGAVFLKIHCMGMGLPVRIVRCLFPFPGIGDLNIAHLKDEDVLVDVISDFKGEEYLKGLASIPFQPPR